MAKYDRAVVVLLAFQYFNQGGKSMMGLAQQDYFKTKLALEPGYIATLSSFIGLPWSVKLLYGMISDNVPLFGTKRKSYVVLLGLLQFVSLLAIYLLDIQSEVTFAVLLFAIQVTGAYLDVLVDAMMVVEAREDEDEGSEQLQSLSWIALGLGGVFGSLVGGMLMERDPNLIFGMYSLYGLIVAVLGLNINEKEEEVSKDGLCTKFATSISEMKQALLLPEIYWTLTYILLSASSKPSFSSYMYFFKMDVVKFS